MSNLDDVYKSKIYQFIYSFGGLTFNVGAFALIIAVTVCFSFFIGLFVYMGTSNAVIVQKVFAFINIGVFMIATTFYRLHTRCRDDSIDKMKKREKEEFGVVKTDATMRYILFDLLYIDVYKNLFLAVLAKCVITGLIGYGLYVYFITYVPQGFSWVALLYAINYVYLPLVIED